MLTVSCNALLLIIEGKIFESADKNELKQSLKPVIDAMGGLLLAVREGAIDVLKKCNENEDDGRRVLARRTRLYLFRESPSS